MGATVVGLPIGLLKYYRDWKKRKHEWRTQIGPKLHLPPAEKRRQRRMLTGFDTAKFIRSGLTGAAIGFGVGEAADLIRRIAQRERDKK